MLHEQQGGVCAKAGCKKMKPANHYPVVIIGAGPTGLMLANLLGVYGVETLLIERHSSTVTEPRAVSIDDESLRAVQNAGALGRVLPDIVQDYGVHYHALSGKVFAQILPASREYGHAKRNAFRQPLFESALFDALKRFPQVSVRMNHELVDFAGANDKVECTLRHAAVTRQVTCDWLVACDGGRSAVREKLGIPMRGATFAERWLIVDLTHRLDAFPHTRTYCDPARATIRLPGPHGTLRYEFMLHPDEDAEQMLDETRIRAWMHERVATDADLPIVRKVVYTFHARMAAAWRKGRVFLAGDAAHLTPPFAGQGLRSSSPSRVCVPASLCRMRRPARCQVRRCVPASFSRSHWWNCKAVSACCSTRCSATALPASVEVRRRACPPPCARRLRASPCVLF